MESKEQATENRWLLVNTLHFMFTIEVTSSDIRQPTSMPPCNGPQFTLSRNLRVYLTNVSAALEDTVVLFVADRTTEKDKLSSDKFKTLNFARVSKKAPAPRNAFCPTIGRASEGRARKPINSRKNVTLRKIDMPSIIRYA